MSMKVAVKSGFVNDEMLRRNLSLSELSALAGTSKAHVSMLLNRKRYAGPEVRKRLMKALKVKDWDVLFEVAE